MGASSSSGARRGLHTEGSVIGAFYRFSDDTYIIVTQTSVVYYDGATAARKLMYAKPERTAATTAVVFAESSDHLIVGDEDGFLRVYAATSGRLQRRLPADSRPAGGSRDAFTKLTSNAHTGAVRVIVCAGADQFLTGSRDGSVRLWSISEGEHVRAFHPPPATASHHFATPSGISSATVGSASMSSSAVGRSGALASGVAALAYDPERCAVIAGYDDGFVRVFRLNDGTLIDEVVAHERRVLSLTVATESDVLLTSGFDSERQATLRIWGLAHNTPLRELCGYGGFTTQCLAYDAHRNLVFMGNRDGSIPVVRVTRTGAGDAELQSVNRIDAPRPGADHRGGFAGGGSGAPPYPPGSGRDSHSTKPRSLCYSSETDRLIVGFAAEPQVYEHVTGLRHDQVPARVFTSTAAAVDAPGSDRDAIHDAPLSSTGPAGTASTLVSATGATAAAESVGADVYDAAVQALMGNQPLPLDEPNLASIEHEESLLGLYIEELSSDHRRQASLRAGFKQLRIELERDLEVVQGHLWEKQRDIADQNRSLLDETTGSAELVAMHERRQSEMKARHEREWSDLLAQQRRERNAWQASQPGQRRRVADQLLRFRSAYAQRADEAVAVHARKMRQLLQSVFPPGSVIRSRFQIARPVSEASTSVYRAIDLAERRIVALKAFPPNLNLNVTLSYDCEGLVPVSDVCYSASNQFIVMPLLPLTLQQLVHSHAIDEELPMASIAGIVHQLLTTLEHLHSQGIVHRDLRPSAVLCTCEDPATLSVQIVHTGVMRALTGDEPHEDGMVFAAPELFGRVVTAASDVWSVGCLLVWLLMRRSERRSPWFAGSDAQSIIRSMVEVAGRPSAASLSAMAADTNDLLMDGSVFRSLIAFVGKLPSPPNTGFHRLGRAPPQAIDLITSMLRFNPNERISVAEALEHPFLAQRTRMQTYTRSGSSNASTGVAAGAFGTMSDGGASTGTGYATRHSSKSVSSRLSRRSQASAIEALRAALQQILEDGSDAREDNVDVLKDAMRQLDAAEQYFTPVELRRSTGSRHGTLRSIKSLPQFRSLPPPVTTALGATLSSDAGPGNGSDVPGDLRAGDGIEGAAARSSNIDQGADDDDDDRLVEAMQVVSGSATATDADAAAESVDEDDRSITRGVRAEQHPRDRPIGSPQNAVDDQLDHHPTSVSHAADDRPVPVSHAADDQLVATCVSSTSSASPTS